MTAIYDRTSEIPFDGNPRKYLVDYCRASHDLKLRQAQHIGWEGAQEYYQSEADKWATCVKWLEGKPG